MSDSQQADFGHITGELVVRDLLDMKIFEAAVVPAGADGLHRRIQRLNVMTVPDILPWIKENEFLLSTEYPLPKAEAELAHLVTEFAARDIAAFGIKYSSSGRRLPQVVLDAADRVALPIVEIPNDVAFDDILSRVFSDIVNRQAATIARSKEIHDAFLQIVLTGGRLPDIAAKLSELLGDAAVVATDSSGRVLAAVHSPHEEQRLADLGLLHRNDRLRISHLGPGVHELDHDLTGIIAPIRAGDLSHGHLTAFGHWDPMGMDVTIAVDQAAVVAALDVTRQLAVTAVERQFEANILHDLVTGTPADIVDALARGATFGWDLQRPLVVMVSRAEHALASGAEHVGTPDLGQQRYIDLWCAEIRNHDRHSASAAFASNLVAVVDAGDDPAALPKAVWHGLKSTTRQEFSIGVSCPVDDPQRIPIAYEEARKALHMGRRSQGPGKITMFGDLGLFRLLSLIDDPDELREFARDSLGRLLELEPRERTELVKTLAVLLDCHLNVAEASRFLHFHYNTMRYRIVKLERLVGPFMSDARLCLKLSVALQVLEMHQVSDAAH
ncbi:PucR family transcriptional regulator ligand-binding domain-containing protein [Saccharopolyspora shandongensis]|uniref:PucR family transcriptional regulator n=1 Tax=Saccharopolyspora shandongensis TaxID=418495 RepID=UPI0033F1C0C7